MIKFDRDVHLTLKNLEKAGFVTYAAGECVRDAIRGFTPYDWDLVTTATIDDLVKMFPKGEIVEGKRGTVLRMDYTYEVENEDETASIEGAVCDIIPEIEDVDTYVKSDGFTVNAIADNPERTVIDTVGSRDDIKDKLVKTIEPADELFKKKPEKMLEAVRIAAELGFDLHKSIYEGILANWRLLMDFDRTVIRRELERLITASFAGKGLNMMADTGLMTVVVGEDVAKKMSTRERELFTELCDNIDKTKGVKLRRLGLLYTCFNKDRGLAAIERLNYDDNTKLHLEDAMKEMIKIQFLGKPIEFKRYLFNIGVERYEYIHNLSKAQRIVYDQPSIKIESRNYMMKTIDANNEPIFIEDLVIDGNDLIEAGIADSPERAEEILGLVVAVVHDNPKNNDRRYLLKVSKKYAKNKLARHTRYVKWLK